MTFKEIRDLKTPYRPERYSVRAMVSTIFEDSPFYEGCCFKGCRKKVFYSFNMFFAFFLKFNKFIFLCCHVMASLIRRFISICKPRIITVLNVTRKILNFVGVSS